MRIERKDSGPGRTVLTGMLVSAQALSQVAQQWPAKGEGLFRSPWENLIAGWAVQYYRKYRKAPGRAVVGLFEVWAETARDRDTAELVESFLSSLSDEYASLREDLNPQLVADLAGNLFNEVRIERLSDQLRADLTSGDVNQALARINAFGKQRVELGGQTVIDVFNDKEAIRRAFEQRREPLFRPPGALGAFFEDSLEQDGFLAVFGANKKGKSWILQDLAWYAVLSRVRTLFLEIGDLSEAQIMTRFMVRTAGRPYKPTHPDRPVRYPTDLQMVETEDGRGWKPQALLEDRWFDDYLDVDEAWEACNRVRCEGIKSDRPYLQLKVTPARTMTVDGVRAVIDDLDARQGWLPKLIVVDYADIMAPAPGFAESRDEVNARWVALRKLSQELHACVIVATQTNAASFNADTLDRSHFSEDNRKLAHVTGVVGVNQKSEEKRDGILRLNWINRREADYDEKRFCYLAGCLAVAHPSVLSLYP